MGKKKKTPKKRKRIAAVQVSAIPNQLRKAGSYPIKECYISERWQERGLANILVLREKSNKNYVVGGFLIDFWCLGLKNTFFKTDISYSEIKQDLLNNRDEIFVPVDENLAHSLIYGAIDYAEKIGFFPHSDFKKSKYILKSRDEIDFDDSLEFGKDGEPVYISGPNESQQEVIRILKHIKKYKSENMENNEI